MGYVMPHVNCEDKNLYGFKYNTAGSIHNAGLVLHTNPYDGLKCTFGGYFSVYHSNRGIMVAPHINGRFFMDEFIVAETYGGLHLRAGRMGNDN